ncbi:PCYCGC motif-containing (lipo)protein [Paenibacillus chitinolyticus]|uniref:PCYCGC motif-containing (lipo)protein n=1 Tax=Paenibacillus chitinolyticus TaxID=79263 RepID=UPI0035DD129F
MKKKWGLLTATLLCASMLAAACESGGAKQEAQGDGVAHHAANGDLQEKTASSAVLPKFLNKQREEIRLVYELAGKNADLLQSMPCYCGCGESAGHKSNQNCFIRETNADGSVVWDDHGTRCGICMEIAVKAISLKKDGKTPLEIRKQIDETYKGTAGKPTDTPLPEA